VRVCHERRSDLHFKKKLGTLGPFENSDSQAAGQPRILGASVTSSGTSTSWFRPIKFFRTQQHRYGNGHTFAPRSRFLPDAIE
jgi:hypothetical protein